MTTATWIRRDRDTGEETEISGDTVRLKLADYYADLDLALQHAGRRQVLTTRFADYWPKAAK